MAIIKNGWLILLILNVAIVSESFSQNRISLQLNPKDFGVWALQKHNEVCSVIFDNVKSGKLSGYNAKNLKETQKETLAKLAVNEVVIFIQTDLNDPTVGKDSAYFTQKSENYHLFKVSDEYVLVKPDKSNASILKFKKMELMALLKPEQKEYFNGYTSGFTLCIDSIPLISQRLFIDYNSKLFEYSKRPDVKLYLTDSLSKVLTIEEKTFLSMDQYTAFLSTDPDDPSIGHDTIILADYNIGDKRKEQALIFTISLNDFKIEVNSISCGLERTSVGFPPFVIPYGYLLFEGNAAYSAAEMNVLKTILHIKMTDDLGNHKENEDNYEDYFGGDE